MAEFKMGTDLMLFKDNTTPLACAKSCKFSVNVNTLDVSSKDSGYFVEKLAGKISFTMSSDNLFVMTDYKELVDAMLQRKPIPFQFSTAKGSAPSWSPNTDGYKGEAYITSIEANAADGEVATYSVNLDGTGALTAVAA